jgi:hypothetical protein
MSGASERRSRSRARLLALALGLLASAELVSCAKHGVGGDLVSSSAEHEHDAAAQTGDARAVAVGLLLDSAPSGQAIDQGLAIAAALRRCYGFEGEDSIQSREALARRAKQDILDPLKPTDAELGTAAASLGYSLDPQVCGNTCENVRNLALIELQKQALLALASAPPGSCLGRTVN